MIREVQEYWDDHYHEPMDLLKLQKPHIRVSTNRVFVIHARDRGTSDPVANFLRKLELEPVIL